MKQFVRWLLLAALISVATLSPLAAQDSIILVPHTDENYGVESVIPEGWTSAGIGTFARQSSPTDTMLIAQQSAPLA